MDCSRITDKLGLCLLGVVLAGSAVATAAEPYPWELLKERDFKRAYGAMLGSHIRHPWLAKLDGPANRVVHIQIGTDHQDFVHLKACRPHNCSSDYITVLYSQKYRVAYARLVLPSGVFMLGRPPEDVAQVLTEP